MLLLAATAYACTGAPDEGEGWPLSEIEAPDSAGVLSDPATEPMAEDGGGSHQTGTAPGGSGGDPPDEIASEDPASEPVPYEARPYEPPRRLTATGPLSRTVFAPPDDFEDARFPRPEFVRGLYVNAWAAGSSRRMSELLAIVDSTEVNSLVIDIKDATGYVSHDTDVELAREIGADGEIRIRDLPGLLSRLEEAGVYPIARIVVVKDPLLAAARPETAVQDTAGGIWVDSKGIIWQNLFNEELWEYNVAIAREVAEMGFPEIQWDYIRFPDAPVSDMERAVFVGGEGRLRVDAVRGFLSYARDELAELPVRSTADVFGVSTSFRRDIGIGQLWETFIDVVDVALPMVYPSHYWEGSFGYAVPNEYPYEVVYAALRDGLRRSDSVVGAGLTRPWLQDFSLGSPIYGAPEVRAQIQATYDVGLPEWILWNPSTRYSVGALEPADGFETEPLIRVGGVLAPVSRRYEVMDSVAAREAAAFELRQALFESGRGEGTSQERPDSDTVRGDPGAIPTDWALPTPGQAPPVDSVAPVDTTVSRGLAPDLERS